MQTLRSASVASLAKVLCRLFTRQKSSGGRPSAPLGSRILTNPDDIFKHNTWDHVQWTDADKEDARKRAQENSSEPIPAKEQGTFDTDAEQYWDQFYEAHQNKFFKDRRWLFLEFPELLPSERGTQTASGRVGEEEEEILKRDAIFHHSCDDQRTCRGTSTDENDDMTPTSSFPGHQASYRILEIGCGAGNSVFPIVRSIKETNAFLYCCDFSPRAIQMVKTHPDYDNSVCHAFVHDIREDSACLPFPPQSLDVILAVFVLSSIHPQRVQGVVNRLSSYLKHGGIFLFRDYGRYDLSQLRFKKGRCLSENFYSRGDGTCVYFFTKDEVHSLFSSAGLEEVQNLEDRRLKVNRGKKVAMHRVWMQSKYRKPHPPLPS